MDLREIGWEGADWIRLDLDMDQWRDLVNMIMNLKVPKKAGNVLTIQVTISFSRSLLHAISFLDCGHAIWDGLAQNRVQWQDFVNVLNYNRDFSCSTK
jgi:hypothetical protein